MKNKKIILENFEGSGYSAEVSLEALLGKRKTKTKLRKIEKTLGKLGRRKGKYD